MAQFLTQKKMEKKGLLCVSGVYGNVRAKMGRKEIVCSWKKSISNIKDVFDFMGKMGS